MLIVVVYRVQQAYRLSFNVETIHAQKSETPPVVKVRLPRYKVTLDVVPAEIIDGVWQISEKAANHLIDSANPGEGGNIVIYGHNSKEIFGPLRWMSVGEDIELTNSQGEVTMYKISQIIETNPDDIDWILPKNSETLTIYTCSGFLNSKRHIVVAYPIYISP